MKAYTKKTLYTILFGLATPHLAVCVDNPHYYKAPYFNATKSFKDKKWLSIVDAHYAAGSTRESKNINGDTVEAFEIYGSHNLLYLTKNVTQPTDMSSTLKSYVDALDTQRTNFENDNPVDNQTFGCVNFCGKLSVDEFVLNYRQNLVSSLFLELNIPIRQVSIGNLTFVDQSPSAATENIPYTQTDTAWINFTDNLEEILMAYGFDGYRCGTKNTSWGDITLLLGIQKLYKSSNEWFDYINLALKAGFLFPTGAERKSCKPFSIETGYNGHWGFPIRLDVVFGLSKDIYVGSYFGLIFFSSTTHANYAVKTDDNQSGFIKLYKTNVREKRGSLYDFGAYLKLDHFFKGLSALAGYSYNRRASNTLYLVDSCEDTNDTIINNDCRLKSWYQHVLHVLVEYDFGVHDYCKKNSYKPRMGIFYDHPFDGKLIFSNAMFGGTIGFDVTWNW